MRSMFVAMVWLICVWLVEVAPLASQTPDHELRLTAQNVHWGYYDAALRPVLRIQSGERIFVETHIARGLGRLRLAGAAEDRFLPSMINLENEVTDRGPGAHPLTGPMYVEGAQTGDVIEVRLLEIQPMMSVGVSGFLPAGGTLPNEYPYAALRLFEIDQVGGVAHMQSGPAIPLRPFFGSIGVAPPLLRGRVSSGPPGYHVGNLDNKELVAGSRLFMPVHVPGALLSIGDGHAAQGDGEVSGTAIEVAMSGTIEVILHKNGSLLWPRAETPTHYVSMGLHADLDEAARLATKEMISFLVNEKNMHPADAYVLCSVALDLRVTQLVDGTKGIHGMLEKSLAP